MDTPDFCIALAKAESEEEAIALLKELKLWDASDAWLPYGATENNFPIVGNQQGSPTAALIEKLTNAIDAVLMAECLRRGIDPEGPSAPSNMVEACEKFFGVPRGRIFNLSPEERRRLAENIYLIATGKKEQPCLSIIDLGEGQTPDRMPDTLLSLIRENKLRIPFVQGKFNMGGSGVLPFCGSQNLQLIISRRHPSIRSNPAPSDGDWGFTIVRRNNPKAGRRSSTYVYLAPNGKILRFKADSLPLKPGKHPEAYGMPLPYGTFIKLYEYRFESKSLARSPIMLDLFYELNRRLHTVPIPVRMAERRSFAKGHSLETMLLGLSVRVEDRKAEILEPGFPVSAELVISDVGKLPLTIFVFKKAEESKDWTTSEEAIFFTINGQSHGTFPAYFYRRRNVGLDYLAKSLLVSIDCEGMDGRVREDLFMPSRDRLRDCEQRKAIEEALEEFLHGHPALRELNARRRQEEIRARVADEKPLAEVLQQVIRSTPSLAALFGLGGRISAPHVPESIGHPFEGKFFPTFFQLEKEPKEGLIKECPKNRAVRVFCQTDAVNDYFTRDRDPGSCTIIPPDAEVSMHLWNGRATVTLKVPENIQPSQTLPVILQVTDRTRMDPFEVGLTLKAGPEDLTERAPRASRPRVGGSKSFDLPNIDEVYRDRWQDEFTDQSALRIKNSGDGGWDFRVNMDNLYLLHALKNAKQEDHEMLRARYKFGLVLFGLAILNELKSDKEDDQVEILDTIAKASEGLAAVLLPMIDALGALDLKS